MKLPTICLYPQSGSNVFGMISRHVKMILKQNLFHEFHFQNVISWLNHTENENGWAEINNIKLSAVFLSSRLGWQMLVALF